MIKERGMLFGPEMVKAILAGIKTQTRRAIKYQPMDMQGTEPYLIECSKTGLGVYFEGYEPDEGRLWWYPDNREPHDATPSHECCPYGKIGDKIYVRETWCICDNRGMLGPCYRASFDKTTPKACDGMRKWKPSIHMPKLAARIWLEIKDIRVERVKDISDEDALAEGCKEWHSKKAWVEKLNHPGNYRNSYHALWDSIYGNWDKNPWVWVIEFEIIKKS